MIEFLKKSFWKKRAMKNHINKFHCVVFPIIENKRDLVDNKYYLVIKKVVYGRCRKIYFVDYKWSEKYDCFLCANEPRCKFEEVIVLDKDSDRAWQSVKSENFLEYDPRTVNALDLQGIKDITFKLQDENSASDDVWEKLISYFDERGLSD